MPTQIPQTFNAGDTVRWTDSFDQYPAADGWVLNYQFINAENNFSVTAVAQGNLFLSTIAAADSEELKSGEYRWRSTVSKEGERHTVGEGAITVKPYFSTQTFDTRTSAKKALDNINAYLTDAKNLSASQYTIAGRTLQRYSVAELLKLKSRFETEVAREEAQEKLQAGLADPRRVLVRFGR